MNFDEKETLIPDPGAGVKPEPRAPILRGAALRPGVVRGGRNDGGNALFHHAADGHSEGREMGLCQPVWPDGGDTSV